LVDQEKTILQFFKQIVDVVSHLHSHDVVWGRVHTDNILLHADEHGWRNLKSKSKFR